jgi:hypothetical protein
MKKITFKNIIAIYIVLIIIQFLILAFSKNVDSVGFEVKKGKEVAIIRNPELYEKYRNSYKKNTNSYNKKLEEELILKVAEQIYVEKLNRMQMDCRLREVSNKDQKNINELVQFFKDTINQMKTVKPDSYEILEFQHQMDVVKKGYSPVQYLMEKILGLRTLEFLINQKNYFYIIITTILFFILLGINLFKGSKS